MSLFTSDRERRLWLWALVAVVAIYSTLGLARTLAGELRERELLGISFGFGMFLIMVGVVLQGLRLRPGGLEIGIALGVAAVYLMVFVRMAIPEERTHLIEYTVVALLIHEALLERVGHGRPVPRPALLALGATVLIGLFDEGIQFFLPSRVFDTRDILFNVLAALMAVTASVSLRWARRRSWRRTQAG